MENKEIEKEIRRIIVFGERADDKVIQLVELFNKAVSQARKESEKRIIKDRKRSIARLMEIVDSPNIAKELKNYCNSLLWLTKGKEDMLKET